MRRSLAVIISALLLVVAGCSATERAGQAQSETNAPITTSSTSTTTVPDTTTMEPQPPAIAVVANDYFHEGIPETATVGTRLSLYNASSAEFHDMYILRLDPSELRTVEELSKLPVEELFASATGRIQSVAFAMPDAEQHYHGMGPQVFSEQGRYVIFCDAKVGADPEQASVDALSPPTNANDGVPRHYQVGEMTEVMVSG
jgi:uncharacterized protein YcfL